MNQWKSADFKKKKIWKVSFILYVETFGLESLTQHGHSHFFGSILEINDVILLVVSDDVSIDGKVHMIYLVLNIKVCGAVNYAAQC